jgi:hypothetical protein
MEEKGIRQLLTEIFYSVLNEGAGAARIAQAMTAADIVPLCRLARKHDLLHVVAGFILDNKIEVEDTLRSKLQRERLTAVYRCEQMKHAFEEICGVLEEGKIPYIPLKGAVLRPYYPYESMRTSCDVDVLIHQEDLTDAIDRLVARGYQREKEMLHDVSLYSPGGIHLELHFNLKEGIDRLDAVLEEAWKYATLTHGYRYDFQSSFFLFHMYAHMAYHFLSGGCGVRSLMDIWITEHKMGLSYTCAEELLQKAGLDRFAAEMSGISNQCFTENKIDEFADLALKYICAGGVYGSSRNAAAVRKSKNNSFIVYVLRRMFLPYRSMICAYPILKKAPILLPFCWVARWVNAIFGGKSKKISSEINCVSNMSDEKVGEVRDVCERLGL